MNSLKEITTNYGKLFYLITYLSKTKQITKDERIKLKEMIIQENKDVVDAIEKYNSSGDENDLVGEIVSLVKDGPSAFDDNSTPPPGNKLKALTSPEDQMLAERKKMWANKPHTIDTFVDSVAEIHETQSKRPEEMKREQISAPNKLMGGMRSCDIGQSPEVQSRSTPEQSKLMGNMRSCNIGQSPEVQPRDLLNI